jgi:hypothetical protein
MLTPSTHPLFPRKQSFLDMGFVSALNISNKAAINHAVVSVILTLFYPVDQPRHSTPTRITNHSCSHGTHVQCGYALTNLLERWDVDCTQGCGPGEVWLAVEFEAPVDLGSMAFLSYDCITSFGSACSRSASPAYGKASNGTVLWTDGVNVRARSTLSASSPGGWVVIDSHNMQNHIDFVWPIETGTPTTQQPSQPPSVGIPTKVTTPDPQRHIIIHNNWPVPSPTATATDTPGAFKDTSDPSASGPNAVFGVVVAMLVVVLIVLGLIGMVLREIRSNPNVSPASTPLTTMTRSLSDLSPADYYDNFNDVQTNQQLSRNGTDVAYELAVAKNPQYSIAQYATVSDSNG